MADFDFDTCSWLRFTLSSGVVWCSSWCQIGKTKIRHFVQLSSLQCAIVNQLSHFPQFLHAVCRIDQTLVYRDISKLHYENLMQIFLETFSSNAELELLHDELQSGVNEASTTYTKFSCDLWSHILYVKFIGVSCVSFLIALVYPPTPHITVQQDNMHHTLAASLCSSYLLRNPGNMEGKHWAVECCWSFT